VEALEPEATELFLQLDWAVAETQVFLERCQERSDAVFTQLFHLVARTLLAPFVSQTSINGYVKRTCIPTYFSLFFLIFLFCFSSAKESVMKTPKEILFFYFSLQMEERTLSPVAFSSSSSSSSCVPSVDVVVVVVWGGMRRPTGLVIGRPLGRIHAHAQTRQSDRRDIFFFDTIQRSSSSSFFYPGPITKNERTNANKRGEEKLFNHGLVYISSRLFLPPTYFVFSFTGKKKSNPELTNKGEVEHLEGPIKRMKKKTFFFLTNKQPNLKFV
jgi:hypothetical protein